MGAGQQNNSKGNGASKRMSNPRRKARREACWSRGQKRKEARRIAAEDAALRNSNARANGELTPWEKAKAARAARRHPESKAA